jgi:4-hydroxyphenylpyruvate dioxygenase
MSPQPSNPVGIQGIAFIEFTSPRPDQLDMLFLAFGFSRLKRHRTRDILYYRQNGIHFLLNREKSGFAADFREEHGPSICSLGLFAQLPEVAAMTAAARGAELFKGESDFSGLPSIYGIGNSLMHFVPQDIGEWLERDFVDLGEPLVVPDKGFIAIDHLTNNVAKGMLRPWSAFYQRVFGFEEVRYFDIRGVSTGLQSYALRSPCGTFCIPINEGSEEKSQIEEYLREYRGPGIQHLAFLSRDLLSSLDKMEDTHIETLEIDDEYYGEVFDRVPNVREDHARIQEKQVLVDGDDDGYILQIFTRNLVGPIFIEMIQRCNHSSFGEGNFGALFRSIERDQKRRGVL